MNKRESLLIDRNQLILRKDKFLSIAMGKPTVNQFNQVMRQHEKIRLEIDRMNEYLHIEGDKIIGPVERTSTETKPAE